jgi:hypothetical protein
MMSNNNNNNNANNANTSTDKINSMSASNSSFNLNSSANNGLDMSSNNPNGSINSGCGAYDDDDVFSNYTNQSNNNNNSAQNPNLMHLNPNNLDALSQLYRNLALSANLNSSNLSDLLSNTPNLSALSTSSDMLNMNSSKNFQNMTNSPMNNANSMNSSLSSANNQINLTHATLAALKQRQNSLLNTRQSASAAQNGSNIAALTSATSNMASLLNNQLSQQQQQSYNNGNGSNLLMNDTNMKRRINSIATTYNLGSSGGQSMSNANNTSLNLGSSSSMFQGGHAMGPNASQILQNSSMATSARLNSSTSSSAAASVLGNNSNLAHTLNGSLLGAQHHQNSGSGNYNSSPNGSSNHGLLSALSLSTPSGKPLRSERLPSHVVDEIIKQAKIRRRMGGKKEVCVFCRNNGEKEQIYTSHTLKDASNQVACPILRLYQCPICHASGDQAHTIKYCPYAEKDTACIKLFKENGRMSAAAAAFLMNSLAGSQTPPSISPPASPSPLQQASQSSFLNQSGSPTISSPNGSSNPFSITQALNSFNSFNPNAFASKQFGSSNGNNGSNSLLTTNANLLSANFTGNGSK